MAVQPHAPRATSSTSPLAQTDVCPWCDQPIGHKKFIDITRRIAAAERERVAAEARRLRDELASQKASIEAQAAADVEAAEKASAAAIAEARKAERKAMKAELEAAAAASKKAEKALKDLAADQDRVLTLRLQEQRAALKNAQATEIAAIEDRWFKEQEALSLRVQALQRQLAKQQADALGEGAGIDLFDALKAAFPGDRVTRIGSEDGANIRHEIVEQIGRA